MPAFKKFISFLFFLFPSFLFKKNRKRNGFHDNLLQTGVLDMFPYLEEQDKSETLLRDLSFA